MSSGALCRRFKQLQARFGLIGNDGVPHTSTSPRFDLEGLLGCCTALRTQIWLDDVAGG